MTNSQDPYHKRNTCFSDFLKWGEINISNPDSSEWKKIQVNYKAKNYNPNNIILDATECFMASLKIQEEFPGPSLLLYCSSINIFAKEDEILNQQMKLAKKLIAEKNKDLLDDENVKAIFQAAKEKSKFDKVGEFLRKEIKEALDLTFFKKDSINLAKEIVSSTNKVRHAAKINKFSNPLAVFCNDHISLMPEDELKHDFIKFDGPVNMIYQCHFSEYQKLCAPARIASAICIFKKINEINSL